MPFFFFEYFAFFLSISLFRLRRDSLPCFGGLHAGGRRRAGISFVLSVSDLDRATTLLPVKPINEDAQCSFLDEKKTCVAEGIPVDGDAIYCAGHTTLSDGRVFLVGGGRYTNVSSAYEHEYGLDYARLFGPSDEFSRVEFPMPLGKSWYPTTALLPNGNVLVTGAFSAYASGKCVGDSCLNSQINVFDVQKADLGLNPWSVLVDSSHADNDWAPGIREYTRVFVLPAPIQRDGVFDLLLMGKKGRVVFMNSQTGATFKPVNGLRPSKCDGDRSDQSTFVPLMNRGGEILIIGGGCDDDTLAFAHFYNIPTDAWTSLNLGIRRRVPSATFLADGRVAIMSGEPVGVDQNVFSFLDASGDPRYVQMIDPELLTVATESARGSTYRGYHNMVALTDDAALLVGGGYGQAGDVGCEEMSIQKFFPSYIASDRKRPEFSDTSRVSLIPGIDAILSINSDTVEIKAVSLVSVNAFTHSYDQNARHVFLPIISRENGSLTVQVPPSPVIFPGRYRIFLIGQDGTPSIAVHASVVLKEDDDTISINNSN